MVTKKIEFPQPRPSVATGFNEAPQAGFDIGETRPGFGMVNRVRLTLGPGGRMVIPAALREAMEIHEGDTILAWVESGELHVLSPKKGARQAQTLLRALLPGGVRLADELIADRRLEAEAEADV